MVTVKNALKEMLEDCDGASTQDKVGFNKFDSQIVRSIFNQDAWTFKQEQLVLKILKKYHKQLSRKGISYDELICENKEIPIEGTTIPTFLPYLDYKEGKFTLKISIENKDLAKNLPNARWIASERIWRYLNTIEFVTSIIPIKDLVEISESARKQLNSTYKKHVDGIKNQESKNIKISQVQEIKKSSSVSGTLPIKSKAYDHQIKAFNIGMSLDKAGLLMEQGTGKTLPAIGIAGARFLNGQVKKLLIIAPLSVLSEWKRQFREHANFNYDCLILGGLKNKEEELKGYKPDPSSLQIVLVNYESSWRLEKALREWKPDMIICDESQKIKNSRSKQGKGIKNIGEKTPYKLILTGTPVSQSPLDFFGQYLFLDHEILGKSYPKFRNEYATMGGWMGKEITGYKNLEQLCQKVHSIAYRVTKKDALELPDTIDQILYSKLEPSTMKMYKEMKKEAQLLLEGGEITAPLMLTRILRLQQITGGFIKTDEGNLVQVSDSKLKVLEDKIEDLVESGKKVVIFARFIPEIDAISNIMKRMKIKSHILKGGVSQQDRESMINNFQNDNESKVFIAQISTGGVGITLTAADTAIFYSVDFSLTNHEQAKARIHRIGQDKKVTYIHILSEGTIDEHILEVLQSKRDVAKMVVDDLKNILTHN